MLVLSRRKEETIEFPELGISVEIIRVEGNKVRLGIKAPDSIRILRGELLEAATDFDDPISLPIDPPCTLAAQAI